MAQKNWKSVLDDAEKRLKEVMDDNQNNDEGEVKIGAGFMNKEDLEAALIMIQDAAGEEVFEEASEWLRGFPPEMVIYDEADGKHELTELWRVFIHEPNAQP